MSCYHSQCTIQSDRRPTFHDVTEQASETVSASGIQNGLLTVFSQHTTCSVLIQEQSDDVNYWGTQFVLQDMVLQLGEFGRIYFADFDQVRARERTVRFTVTG